MDDRWNRLFPLIFLPVIVLTFYVTACAHFGYTPREAFSYMEIAKGLNNGKGFLGETQPPALGVMCPLWILIISLGGKLGVDPFIAAKGMDLVFASFSLIVCYFLAYEVIRDVVLSLCASLALSVSARFLQSTATGLEMSLAVLLLLAAMRSCLRNEYVLATIMAVLLSLVRPEGFLLMILILTDVFINSFDVRRALKMSAVLLLIYCLGMGLWLFYAYPAALSVFHAGIAVPTSALEIPVSLLLSDGVAAVVLVVSVMVMIFRMRRSRTGEDENHDERMYLFRQSTLGIGWLVLELLAGAMRLTNPAGDFLVLVVPVIIVYALLFLSRVIRGSKQIVYAAVMAFIALVVIENQIVYRFIILPAVESAEIVRDLK